MKGNKWDKAKYLILSLPFLFVAAFLLDLPIWLPAWILPERIYLCLGSGGGPDGHRIGAEDLRRARGRSKEAFLALPGGLRALPKASQKGRAWEEAASALPDLAQTGPVLADLEAGLPFFRRARVIADQALTKAELEAFSRVSSAAGIPLAIDQPHEAPSSPLVSLSWRRKAGASSIPFELLLSPSCRSVQAIELRLPGKAGGPGKSLWKGSGSTLPKDLVLRLEAGQAELAQGMDLIVGGASLHLDLGAGLDQDPRVLVISPRPESKSWIEENWPSKVLGPGAAAKENLLAYELIVLDGIPLASIKGELLGGLLEVASRRSGSILLAADSPDFGKEGDSPELEALLPVELKPRKVKDLPDLGLLLLIDTSGSMFGDKLSLAKVTGLELLAQLKPQDRVGLMLFSDERRWVYDFVPNSSIKAAPVVDPIPAQGGTDLAKALDEGLGRLEAQALPERHAVVVSDGVTRPADFQALAARAREGRISISTMGVGKDVNRALLERLARQTGGRYYPVASAEEIPSLLFEDRKSLARPPFVQEETPIFALNGLEVSRVGGMSLLSGRKGATVLLTDALGDPLLSSKELGNRAILVFASDLHGSYTGDFFRSKEAAGLFKDRLDALFAEEPLEVSLLAGGRGVHVHLASSSLVAPSLVLSAPGEKSLEYGLSPAGPGAFEARLALPRRGAWTAAIFDRGTSLGSFGLASSPGPGGMTPGDLEAGAAWKAGGGRSLAGGPAWLILAFAASLATTLFLRARR